MHFLQVVLKPTRKLSTYVYRDMLYLQCLVLLTAKFSGLDDTPRKKKLKKTIEAFRRRLIIKQKKLKNIRAQKNRANKKVLHLSEIIKNT